MALYDEPDRTVIVFDTMGLYYRSRKRILDAHFLLKQRFPKADIFASPFEAADSIVKKFKP
jgi:hypothetical protein